MEKTYEQIIEEREKYRNIFLREINGLKKLKEQEDKLSVYGRIKRAGKNFGLEFAASFLEGLCSVFKIGGVSVGFDNIRMKKNPNMYRIVRKSLQERWIGLHN